MATYQQLSLLHKFTIGKKNNFFVKIHPGLSLSISSAHDLRTHVSVLTCWMSGKINQLHNNRAVFCFSCVAFSLVKIHSNSLNKNIHARSTAHLLCIDIFFPVTHSFHLHSQTKMVKRFSRNYCHLTIFLRHKIRK